MKSISKKKLKKIISDSYDDSGMNPGKKDVVCQKTLPFIQDMIKIAQKVKKGDKKTIELSEDLLFNGLLD